jgi:hypothetical protein
MHGATRHAILMELDIRRGTWGRRLSRQIASEVLLHCKQWRRQQRTSVGGRAQATAWDGGAQAKLTSNSCGARAARGRGSRAAVAECWWRGSGGGLRRRRAGEAHERQWRGTGGCGCGGAWGCLRRQLGLGAKQWMCEWVLWVKPFRPELFRLVCWRLA